MEQTIDQNTHNPADQPLVTFDTNILIALRNNEADAQPALQLLALNRAGVITVNVTLSTALEKQRLNEKLNMQEYSAWLEEQGIAPGNIFSGPRTIPFLLPGDPNILTFDVQRELALNMHIHQILFPNIPFRWSEYLDQECIRRNIVGKKRQAFIELDQARYGIYIPPTPQAPTKRPSPTLDTLDTNEQEELHTLNNDLHRTWMNAKNDALGFFHHLTQSVHTIYPERAIFVTSDRNFLKQTKLVALKQCGYRGKILRPGDAIDFILNVTSTTLP
jgi:hypothetical protein